MEAIRGYASEELLDRLSLGHPSEMSININKQNDTMNIVVKFTNLVTQSDILSLERELIKSLELTSVRICTVFPPELFTTDYFSEILIYIKRDNATLKRAFNDAEARIEDNRFIITLYHGGETVIHGQNAERLISDAIYKMFGKRYNVEFDGITVMSSESEEYIEMQQQVEERNAREESLEQVEKHEEVMRSADERKEKIEKSAPEIEVREGETLTPVIADKSAKPLFGRALTKINTIPINTLTAETGSCMIWGDIFSLDFRTTKDGKKYIISILITDYTSSMTIKIIESCDKCKPLDILKATIKMLNKARDLFLETKDKKYWWQMIQLLQTSYNQRRTIDLNYEVLAKQYRERKSHKLDEWREYCEWIKSLPYSELITLEDSNG